MPNDNIKDLYNALITDGKYTEKELGTIDEFESWCTGQDGEKNVRQLHQALLTDGYRKEDVGDENEFLTYMGFTPQQNPNEIADSVVLDTMPYNGNSEDTPQVEVPKIKEPKPAGPNQHVDQSYLDKRNGMRAYDQTYGPTEANLLFGKKIQSEALTPLGNYEDVSWGTPMKKEESSIIDKKLWDGSNDFANEAVAKTQEQVKAIEQERARRNKPFYTEQEFIYSGFNDRKSFEDALTGEYRISRGEMEDEVVNKFVTQDTTLSDAFGRMWDRAVKDANKEYEQDAKSGYDGWMRAWRYSNDVGGNMAQEMRRQYNYQSHFEPQKFLDALQNEVNNLTYDPTFADKMLEAANKLDVTPMEMQYMIGRQMEARVQQMVNDKLIERYIPKSQADFILGGAFGIIQKLINGAPISIRQIQDQARAISQSTSTYKAWDEEKGQYVDKPIASYYGGYTTQHLKTELPGWVTPWSDEPAQIDVDSDSLLSSVFSLAADAPFFGVGGKITGYGLSRLMAWQLARSLGEGVTMDAALRLISIKAMNSGLTGKVTQTLLGKAVASLPQVIQGGGSFFGYGTLSTAAQQAHEGRFDMWEILKNGAKEGFKGMFLSAVGYATKAPVTAEGWNKFKRSFGAFVAEDLAFSGMSYAEGWMQYYDQLYDGMDEETKKALKPSFCQSIAESTLMLPLLKATNFNNWCDMAKKVMGGDKNAGNLALRPDQLRQANSNENVQTLFKAIDDLRQAPPAQKERYKVAVFRAYSNVMKDANLSTKIKSVFAYGLRGSVPLNASPVTRLSRNFDDNEILSYDAAGNLVDRKQYDSEDAMNDAFVEQDAIVALTQMDRHAYQEAISLMRKDGYNSLDVEHAVKQALRGKATAKQMEVVDTLRAHLEELQDITRVQGEEVPYDLMAGKTVQLTDGDGTSTWKVEYVNAPGLQVSGTWRSGRTLEHNDGVVVIKRRIQLKDENGNPLKKDGKTQYRTERHNMSVPEYRFRYERAKISNDEEVKSGRQAVANGEKGAYKNARHEYLSVQETLGGLGISGVELSRMLSDPYETAERKALAERYYRASEVMKGEMDRMRNAGNEAFNSSVEANKPFGFRGEDGTEEVNNTTALIEGRIEGRKGRVYVVDGKVDRDEDGNIIFDPENGLSGDLVHLCDENGNVITEVKDGQTVRKAFRASDIKDGTITTIGVRASEDAAAARQRLENTMIAEVKPVIEKGMEAACDEQGHMSLVTKIAEEVIDKETGEKETVVTFANGKKVPLTTVEYQQAQLEQRAYNARVEASKGKAKEDTAAQQQRDERADYGLEQGATVTLSDETAGAADYTVERIDEDGKGVWVRDKETGSSTHVDMDRYKEMYDHAKNNGGQAYETVERPVVESTTVETPVNEAPAAELPMKGGKVDIDMTTPSEAYDFYEAQGAGSATDMAESYIEELNAEIGKLNEKLPITGTHEEKMRILQEKQARKQRIEEAKRELDFWKRVKNEANRREAQKILEGTAEQLDKRPAKPGLNDETGWDVAANRPDLVKDMDELGKALGVEIVLVPESKEWNGRRPKGMNRIYVTMDAQDISLRGEASFRNKILQAVMGHELNHDFFEKVGGFKEEFIKLVKDYLQAQAALPEQNEAGLEEVKYENRWDQLVAWKGEAYSKDMVEEEIACDMAGTMLADQVYVDRLLNREVVEEAPRKLSTFGTITNFIRTMINKVRGHVQDEQLEQLKKMQDSWEKAYRTRAKQDMTAQGVDEETATELADAGLVVKDGLAMNKEAVILKEESGYLSPLELEKWEAKNPEKVWTVSGDSGYYTYGYRDGDGKFIIDLSDPRNGNSNLSKKTEPAWRDSFLSGNKNIERAIETADAIRSWYDRTAMKELAAELAGKDELEDGAKLASEYMKEGKYYPNANGTDKAKGPLRSNVEYILTFDLDTTCPRTFQYLYYCNEIEKQLGRPLRLTECQQLIELMRINGQQIPCTYCYAENKRQALKEAYHTFMKAHQAVLAAVSDAEAMPNMYGYNAKNLTKKNPSSPLTDAQMGVFKRWRKNNPLNNLGFSVKTAKYQYDQTRNIILSDMDEMHRAGKISVDDGEAGLVEMFANKYGITDELAKESLEEIVHDWYYDTTNEVEHENFERLEEDDIFIDDYNRTALNRWGQVSQYNPSIRQMNKRYLQARNIILRDLDMAYEAGKIEEENGNTKTTNFLCSYYYGVALRNKTPEEVFISSALNNIVNEWRYDKIEGTPHSDYTKPAEGVELTDLGKSALALWDEMSKYAKSSSQAKNVSRYYPYTNELSKVSTKDKNNINGIGGLRMHSTNDFRIDYVGDYFQLIADMEKYGWMGHTYTKSPDFVKIFGRTGYRINMSCAAYDVYEYDKNGEVVMIGTGEFDKDGKEIMRPKVAKVIPNTDEGFLWFTDEKMVDNDTNGNSAQWLRKHYSNAGAMMMTTSPEQLQYALDADWVDMIIPFHASGLPKAFWYNMRRWTDYTRTQNERFYNTDEMRQMLTDEYNSGELKDKLAGKKEIPYAKMRESLKNNDRLPKSVRALAEVATDDEVFVEFAKRARSEDIYELFMDTHPEIHVEKKKTGKDKGKRHKPHFLPGETTSDGVKVPGWKYEDGMSDKDNLDNYFRLCKEWGVRPRFYGIKVQYKGKTVDITEHPGYIKLIKETARMDTKQETVKFNLDQEDANLSIPNDMNITPDQAKRLNLAGHDFDEKLGEVVDFTTSRMFNKVGAGVTPMDYAMYRLIDSAKDGINKGFEDTLGIIPTFLKEYAGKNRPLEWLPEDAHDTWARVKRSLMQKLGEEEDADILNRIPYHEKINATEADEVVVENEEEEDSNFSKKVLKGMTQKQWTDAIDSFGAALTTSGEVGDNSMVPSTVDATKLRIISDITDKLTAKKDKINQRGAYTAYDFVKQLQECLPFDNQKEGVLTLPNGAEIGLRIGDHRGNMYNFRKDRKRGAQGVYDFVINSGGVFNNNPEFREHEGFKARNTGEVDAVELVWGDGFVDGSAEAQSQIIDGLIEFLNTGSLTKTPLPLELNCSGMQARRFRRYQDVGYFPADERRRRPRIGETGSDLSKKTLAGVHNISEENLRKALRLGGLANPSVAVIDTDKNTHTEFGEISLILPSSKVDSRTGDNAGTWTDDVWTPTYPNTRTVFTTEGGRAFRNMLDELPIDKELRDALKTSEEQMQFGSQPNFGWLYLKQAKKTDATVYNHPDIPSDWQKFISEYKNVQELLNAVDADEKIAADLDRAINRYFATKLQEEHPELVSRPDPDDIKSIYKAYKVNREKAVEIYATDGEWTPEDIEEAFYNYKKRSRSKKNGVDANMTMVNASKIIDAKGLYQDYIKWLDELYGKYGVKEQIRDGNDRNGNAKYIPNTVANASKVMNKRSLTGDHTLGGWGIFISQMAKHMNSLDDIRDNKDRLGVTKDNEFAEFVRSNFSQFPIMLNNKNRDLDLWDGTASKAFASLLKNIGNVKSYARQRYGITLSDSEVDAIKEFNTAFRAMPADYFETKFDRPVNLSEFAAAVVPKNTSPDIIQSLQESGLTVHTYNPNKEGDRERVQRKAMNREDVLFSKKIQQADPFYSNAAKAVEGINQEKATADQWLNMLKNKGGIKAEEDKWMGLTDWLNQQGAKAAIGDRSKTITKDEIAQFVAENAIKIEEVHYGQNETEFWNKFDNITKEYEQEVKKLTKDRTGLPTPEEAKQVWDDFGEQMYDKYGASYTLHLSEQEKAKNDELMRAWQESKQAYMSERDIELQAYSVMIAKYGDDFRKAFYVYDGKLHPRADYDANTPAEAYKILGIEEKPINDTRQRYQMDGLENYKEIALTVPTIEPYRGELPKVHFADEYTGGKTIAWIRFGEAQESAYGDPTRTATEFYDFVDDMAAKYNVKATRPEDVYSALNNGDRQTYDELYEAMVKSHDNTGKTSSKVLVIDEIQSQRHEDAREVVGKDKDGNPIRRGYNKDWMPFLRRRGIYGFVGDRYNKQPVDKDGNIITDLTQEQRDALLDYGIGAMKNKDDAVPDAPFQNNWHELTMKRMLRYAAENGYDKVAWTTGQQQSNRYNLGGYVEQINSYKERTKGEVVVNINIENGRGFTLNVDEKTGMVNKANKSGYQFLGKKLSDIIGVELANKMLTEERTNLEQKDLVVGGEGMKSFYDDMLPRFMSKYGKKWGAKVGTVELELPNTADRFMHSIDITPEMKESVMQGQAMFSKKAKDKEYADAVKRGDKDTAIKLLKEKADEQLNTLILPNDDDYEGFKYHTGKAPERTFKRYAVMNVSPDGFKAAYAGNENGTPVGVWLDAQNLKSYVSDLVQFDDGTFASYIVGDTGASVASKFSPEKREEYGLKGSDRLLLERGGKHSSDVPNFSQMNLHKDENGNKVNSSKEGALPHNKLIFEIEYGTSADGDITEYVKENGRMMRGKNQGLAKIEPNQFYDFKTNPNAVGNWGIGGTFRIVRLVPHEEVVAKTAEYKENAIAEAKRAYEAGEITKGDRDKRIKNAKAITLQKWVGGYHPEDFGLTVEGVDELYKEGQKAKVLDITYDDNGELIPLSERMNPEKDDVRYSKKMGVKNGIYVNDDTKEHYGTAIVKGDKTVETRTPEAWRRMQKAGIKVGDELAIISKGKIIGYVTLSDVKQYKDADDFYSDENVAQHLVQRGGGYAWDDNTGKVGLVFTKPVELDQPVELGAGHGTRSYYIFDDADYSNKTKEPLLGAPYTGSKNIIGRELMSLMPKGKRFVDLMTGGGAMTHAALLSGKYDGVHMNDLDTRGMQLFLGGVDGKYRDYELKDMDAETFKAVKETPEAFLYSHGANGRSFSKLDSDGHNRAQTRLDRVKALEALAPLRGKISTSDTDYRDVQFGKDDVLYADIPYRDTDNSAYGKNGTGFDYDALEKWGAELDQPLFISSGAKGGQEVYQPKGFTELWSKTYYSGGHPRTEKLFVQDKFADREKKRIQSEKDNDILGYAQRKVDDNAQHSFKGVQGAARLDAVDGGRRMEDLEIAKEMFDKAKDADGQVPREEQKKIKFATGWEMGADGKWRHESIGLKFKLEMADKPWGKKVKLSDLFEDNEVFQAYPELNNITIKKTRGGGGGAYSQEDNTITVGTGDVKWGLNLGLKVSDNLFGRYVKELNGTLNHEVQHAIQAIEGFARGGSHEWIRVDTLEGLDPLVRNFLKITSSDMTNFTKAQIVNWLEGRLSRGTEDAEKLKNVQEALDGIRDMQEWEFRDFGYKLKSNVARIRQLAALRYPRLAGEVESRNTEARMDMTEDEIRNSLALETEDQPRSEQIVNFYSKKDIHTENFKRWFGDWEKEPEKASKVVDENGEPLVVYHGSNDAYFTEFENGEGSNLAWFSKSKTHANRYAEFSRNLQEKVEPIIDDEELSPNGIYPVYLDIKNPLTIKGTIDDTCDSDTFWELADALDMTPEDLVAKTRNYFSAPYKSLADVPMFEVTNSVQFRDILKGKGYDGVVTKEFSGEEGYVTTYGVADPTQIKSATKNNGDYDPMNPDIRYSKKDTRNLTERSRDWVKMRRQWDIDTDGYVNLDKVGQMFHTFNQNQELGALFEKVRETIKNRGIVFSFTDDIADGIAGQSGTFGGIPVVEYKKDSFSFAGRDDQTKAKIILHEMIHQVATDIQKQYNRHGADGLTDVQKACCAEFEKIYQAVKQLDGMNGNDKRFYGLKNSYEMVAELANPEFRDWLSRQEYSTETEVQPRNLWQWAKDTLKKMFGGDDTTPTPEGGRRNALAGLAETFDSLMDEEMDNEITVSNTLADGEQFSKKDIRTENFKNWFGDWENDPKNASKVVDKDGEPLVMYHGTDKDFSIFSKGDIGFHFGTKEQAENKNNARVEAVYLDIKNPLRLPDLNEDWETYFIREWMVDKGYLDRRTANRMLQGFYEENVRNGLDKPWNGSNYEGAAAKWIRNWLNKNGYDGIVYSNEHEGKGDSWVALYPNQVKSATDNVGTYSRDNDDINYSRKIHNIESPKDFVAENFRTLNQDDLKRELGWQAKDYKGLSRYLRRDGMSIQKAAEEIWGDMDESMQAMCDDQDVRNWIIELLGEGGPARYFREKELIMKEDDELSPEEIQAREEYYQEAYGMSYEEYQDYENMLKQKAKELFGIRRPKRRNTGYSTGSVQGAQKEVVDQINELLGQEYIGAIDKRDLRNLMSAIRFATPRKKDQMIERAKTTIIDIRLRAQARTIENLLKLKTKDKNGRNMSIAKNVDADTAKVFEVIRKDINEMTKVEIQSQIDDVNKRIYRGQREKAALEAELNSALLSDIEAQEVRHDIEERQQELDMLRQELNDLKVRKQEAIEEKRGETVTDLANKIQALKEKQYDADEGKAEWTDEDDNMLTAYTILEQKTKVDEMDTEIYNIIAEMGRQGTKSEIEAYRSMLNTAKAEKAARQEVLTQMLTGLFNTGAESLKTKREAQKEHNKALVRGIFEDISDKEMPKGLHNEAGVITKVTNKLRGRNRGTWIEESEYRGKAPSWWRYAFGGQLKSFEYMAHRIDRNHMSHDGWFYKHFIMGDEGQLAATNAYLRNVRESFNELNTMSKSIFGKSLDKVAEEQSDLIQSSGVWTYKEVEPGKFVPIEQKALTKGQATYLYMVWKMGDGKVKMTKMGYTEKSIEQIKDFIGAKNRAWADWVQDTYLPSKRVRYNEIYKDIYGADLKQIDKYVPLKISRSEIREDNDMSGDKLANTSGSMAPKTGALIERRFNTLPINESADAFNVIVEHINNMEEFGAFGKLRKDMEYILNSRAVREQLNANVEGSFVELRDAARIALHCEDGGTPDKADVVYQKVAKGLAGGAIAFRNTTAFKQILSVPAFYGYSQDPRFIAALTKNILGQYTGNAGTLLFNAATFGLFNKWQMGKLDNSELVSVPYSQDGSKAKVLANRIGAHSEELIKSLMKTGLTQTVKWCVENMPSFRERLMKGNIGIEEMDATLGTFIDGYLAKGMSENKLVDAITCAIGIKSIFDYKYAREKERINKEGIQMRKDGATEQEVKNWKKQQLENARNFALMEADVYYNGTQQSNHRAFMSPMQLTKSAVGRSVSLFQNASIGFARKTAEAAENIWKYRDAKSRRKLINGYLNSWKNSGRLQDLLDSGMSEDDAIKLLEKDAAKIANNKFRKSVFSLLLYGLGTNIIWDLGGRGLLGWFQNDEEKKWWQDWTNWTSYPMRGLVGVNATQSVIKFIASEDKQNAWNPMMGFSELSSLLAEGKKSWGDNGWSPEFAMFVFNRGTKFSGFSMETWANTFIGLSDLVYHGVIKHDGEATKFVDLMLLLQTPNSNRANLAKELYKDEPFEKYLRDVMYAMKYVDSDSWTHLIPGNKVATERRVKALTKELLQNQGISLSEVADAVKTDKEALLEAKKLKGKDDLMKAYDAATDPQAKAAIGKKLMQAIKDEEWDKYSKEEKIAKAKETLSVSKDKTEQAKANEEYKKYMKADDLLQDEHLKQVIKDAKKYADEYNKLAETSGAKAAMYYQQWKAQIDLYDKLKDVNSEINELKKDFLRGKDPQKVLDAIRAKRVHALNKQWENE